MKILEIFSGTKSISKAFKVRGHETFTVDFNPDLEPDMVVDILALDLKALPWIPDVIWASPPCQTFSVASIGHHWAGGKGAYIPRTEAAKIGLLILRRTEEIIKEIDPRLWFMENPRGLMRKLTTMPGRRTVTYCQYGDTKMKPTDCWSNASNWIPRPMCHNGDSCHEAAPRGAKTGTQGIKGARDRGIIPAQLCNEIVDVCEQEIKP